MSNINTIFTIRIGSADQSNGIKLMTLLPYPEWTASKCPWNFSRSLMMKGTICTLDDRKLKKKKKRRSGGFNVEAN